MRSVREDANGLPTKVLAEINHAHFQHDCDIVKNGVTGDGHGISEEDESRVNEDANRGRVEAILHAQQQLQGPQGKIIRWERFLPLRSLTVLLVENDDSTRQVVSALLRNCSYEVTAVSNSLQAWKILEDRTNHIDLVLTEVDMPRLSGIGLLSKIMNHKTCKNIPVIMMSSNDSIAIVFKSFSKGAVDFLVKPIRKNELKNLWQHVWRKSHSSSGSGSESGIRTKSTKSKSVDGSTINADSNDEEDNGSIGLDYRDESDNGSGTQSSWSKMAVEVDSPQPMAPWDDSADPPDSTCAQVIHSRPEAHSSNWVPIDVRRKSEKQDYEPDNFAMGKDLSIGVPRNPHLLIKWPGDKGLEQMACTGKGKLSNPKEGKHQEKAMTQYSNEASKDKLQEKDHVLTNAITKTAIPQGRSVQNEVPNDQSNINIKDSGPYDKGESPSLELSLNRPRDVENIETYAQERNILKRSDHSAFSRYNTPSTANQAPTGNMGSCSPVNNSSEAVKTESMQNLQSNSSRTPKNGSNGSSNNNDMGSTTNNAFTKPEADSDKSMPSSSVSIQTYSAFQPVQHSPSIQTVITGNSDASKTAVSQARALHQQAQVEHHHHHHYHHHHHHHQCLQQNQLVDDDDLSLRNMTSADPHSGLSNMLGMEIEGNAANYGSASGSNNGSNGHNGSSTDVIPKGKIMGSEDGEAGTCGAGSGSRISVHQNQTTQREAALNKFRQKRKERCFEKKVRYQSRKKLAEQRARVRGQFVRQTVDENKNIDEPNDSNS